MTALVCDDAVCQLEIVGPAEAPVIVVLGGISASRHVTTWWNDFTGPGKTIDTDRYRVASIDYRSTDAVGKPLLTLDHARELCHALDAENIERVHAIVGASYGGMIALAFGSIASERVGRLIVFGAAHESSPVATAHRILQRRVVEIGLKAGAGIDSLIVARGLAVTTYSTAAELATRFDIADAGERQQEIEQFLTLAGYRFASQCTPERFLALSHSLDSHCVDPRDILAPVTLIGVREDVLVPVQQVERLASALGSRCTLEIISSRYGHDAFLNDIPAIAPIVARALAFEIGTES